MRSLDGYAVESCGPSRYGVPLPGAAKRTGWRPERLAGVTPMTCPVVSAGSTLCEVAP